MTSLYWFRNDLRLYDQPSFKNACTQATRLLPVFIHDSAHVAPTRWGFERLGPHRKYALRSALQALKVQLRQQQSDLLEYSGDPCQTLIALAKQVGAKTIFCEDIAAPDEQQQVIRLRQAGRLDRQRPLALEYDKLKLTENNGARFDDLKTDPR